MRPALAILPGTGAHLAPDDPGLHHGPGRLVRFAAALQELALWRLHHGSDAGRGPSRGQLLAGFGSIALGGAAVRLIA